MTHFVAVWLLCLFSGVAIAEAPGDFAFGIPLETVGPEALFEVEVPAAVYAGVVRADLGDLRVFNAAGEPVPHAFLPRSSAPRSEPPLLRVPFFALRGDAGAGVAAVEVRIERQQGRAVVTMNGRDLAPFRDATVLGYLVDASALDQPLQALALELAQRTGDIASRVQVDASNDLARWTTLVVDAPVLHLQAGGERFEQLRVQFPTHQAKYFRLSWPTAQPFELASVKGEPGAKLLEAPRRWLTVTGTSVANVAGEYTFDIGGKFPVDRLRMTLPHSNTIASAEFLARDGTDDQWRRVVVGSVYRLGLAGQEVVSPDLEIAATTDRHWRLRVDQRGGGLGAGLPALAAGWLPQRLVFAARGPAPFQLVYGSNNAQPAAYSIVTLVPGYGTDAALLPIGKATSGTPRTLGGDSAIRQPINWVRWAMWGSLLLGVALLGWMAWRLARQLSPAKTARPCTPDDA